MNTNMVFSIESFEESGQYIVKYPDGSCDIMSLDEIRKNFEIPIQGGEGQHKDYESAMSQLMEEEDQVPGDFFFKAKVASQNAAKRGKGQFASKDHSLI